MRQADLARAARGENQELEGELDGMPLKREWGLKKFWKIHPVDQGVESGFDGNTGRFCGDLRALEGKTVS